MNERIRELSQLAWTKTSEAVPFYDSTGNISRDFNLKYQQEFAELIVKECIDIVDAQWEPVLVEKIREHFGVEE